MNATDFVSRLDKARRTGNGRWLACCPAHEDRSPSLSVRETDDGRTLVYCFAQCTPGDIVGALGLELHDLYPERSIEAVGPYKQRFPAADVLEGLQQECIVVAVIASDLAKGKEVNQEDRIRMWQAIERILAGRDLALGER